MHRIRKVTVLLLFLNLLVVSDDYSALATYVVPRLYFDSSENC